MLTFPESDNVCICYLLYDVKSIESDLLGLGLKMQTEPWEPLSFLQIPFTMPYGFLKQTSEK